MTQAALELKRILDRDPQMEGLARNPLLLAIICLIFENKGQLPKRRVELYQEYIEMWLMHWRQKKVPSRDLTPRKQIRLLEHLAFAFFLQEKFTETELLDEIETYLQDHRAGHCRAEVILDQILQTSGLLVEERPGFHRFLHLTFQEFLAACALAGKTELVQLNGEEIPKWLELVKPHLFDPRWEEVIRLLASKLEDATRLIEAIWQESEDICLNRLLLAGNCLVDTSHVQDWLRKQIIQGILILLRDAFPGQQKAETPTSQFTSQDVAGMITTSGKFQRMIGMLANSYDEVLQQLLLSMPDVGRRDSRIKWFSGTFKHIGSEKAVHALVAQLEDLNRVAWAAAVDVLGEVGSEQAVPFLIRLLEDPNSLVRQAAAVELGQIGGQEAVPYLIQMLEVSKSADSLEGQTAAMALGRICSMKALSALIAGLEDPNYSVRRIAADALGETGSEEPVPHLLQKLQDTSPYVRAAASRALSKLGSKEALPDLLKLLKDFDPIARAAAAVALGNLGSKETAPHLLQISDDLDTYVRWNVADALGRLGSEAAVPILVAQLGDPFTHAAQTASTALGRIGNGQAIQPVYELARRSPHSRAAALMALRDISQKQGIRILLDGSYTTVR